MTQDFTWHPGTVMAGWIALKVGQSWTFYPEGPLPLFLRLTLVSLSPEGEVVLRPLDPGALDAMFPVREVLFKGKPAQSRPGCPFSWIDADQAKASKGARKEGDLLAHEAWSVWAQMALK